MKRNLIYVFAAALAALFSLQSCGLEEPFPGPQDGISEGSVEFVARPASYNNHEVTTKAAGDFNDAAIHNAFLILFNRDGKRILFEEINIADEQLSAKIDKGLGDVTACILANVPASFAQGIIGTTKPEDGSANQYLNTAVLDLTYDSSKSGILGVPVLDLDNNTSTSAVPCIPMFGQTDSAIDLTEANSVIEIGLKRMFAKVSVELKLDHSTNLSTAQASTNFELNSYRLVNLPLKVSLLPQDAESAWVNDGDSFAGENSHVASEIKHKIYDADYILASDAQKKYTFDVYVPEYRLEPLPSTTDNYGQQEYKPMMYHSSKKAVHIVLRGSYIPGSGSSTVLDYSVFLGEDASTSFTLNRNVQYNNYLTITGITKKADNTDAALIDHRVTMSDGNMVSMFGEVANCYVISATGTYSFPAYKGAYKADDMDDAPKCTRGTKVEIIAQNGATNLFTTDANGNPVFNLTTNPAGEIVISFDVVDSWDDANVILALKDDSGNIEWSWHLWFVHGPSLGSVDLSGFFQMESQLMPNGVNELMDRNLGALYSATNDGYAGAATGFYYRYGQIAPYFTDTKSNSTTYHGHKLPDDSSWNLTGGKKSANDPCPPGYYVPKSTMFDGNATLEDASLTILGSGIQAFRYWNNNTSGTMQITDDIYFPYSAYIKNAAGDMYVGPQNQQGGSKYTETTQILRYDLRIQYNEIYSINNGVFWATDGAIEYSMRFNEIADGKILEYKKSSQGWDKATRINLESLGSGTLNNLLKQAANKLIETISIKDEGDLKMVELSKATDYYAAQVRCVKE